MKPSSFSRVRKRATACAAAAAAIAVLLAAVPAEAQAPPADDSVTAIARQRYKEGVAAYEAGRFEDARLAFAQAYALKHHPAVLLNLGQAELRSRHEDEAGNHLQQFLREFSSATPDERAAAEKALSEVKRSMGHVTVTVDAAGADLSVDGATLGKSPLADAVYVKPGKHTVFASLEGRSGVAAFEVRAGGTATAVITLGPGGAGVPPPAVPPVVPPVQPIPSFSPPPSTSAPPPVVAPPPSSTSRDGEMSFGDWYTHRPVAWVGTGVAVLGLAMGIGGGVAAMNASSASTADTASIQQEIATRHDPSNVCNPAVLAANPTLNSVYGSTSSSQACSTLQGDINRYHTGIDVMATGYALLGVGVVGTVIYALVDFPSSRSSGSSRVETLPVALAPVVSPTFRGVGAVGKF